MAQYGFYLNTAKCTGCKTCQLACKDYKDLDVTRNFRRVYEYTGGEWKQEGNTFRQDVFAYYASISCNHCDEPICVEKCPTGAMHKRKQDGLVAVNQEECIGCKRCAKNCPYGAPQYDKSKRKMSKCDGCFERLAEGKQPICVEACPLRALEFGEISELRAKYGTVAEVAPLPSADQTKPNLVLGLGKHSQPVGSTKGVQINIHEVKSL